MSLTLRIASVLLVLELTGCAAEEADEAGQAGEGALADRQFPITWMPTSESQWDFKPFVERFQALGDHRPSDMLAGSEGQALRRGVSVHFEQSVVTGNTEPARDMTVELTLKTLPVPYETFRARFRTDRWGPNLAHYIGGSIRVLAKDSLGRATRQVERMVLSPFDCEFDSDLTNNDMTKLEIVEDAPTSARVYWKVMHSDNNSTPADIGSVEFRAFGEKNEETLVIFHSAHRVNAVRAIPLPSWVLGPSLSKTFLDHVDRYAKLVGVP